MCESAPDISRLANLLADPGRSRMLLALMDGRLLPASDLATAAGLSAQAASNHLARLLDGGVLRVEQRGRFRYYTLADGEIARAIEALQVAAHGLDRQQLRLKPKGDAALRQARTCYRHLAGRLGVGLCQAMQAQGWLLRDEANQRFEVSASGRQWLLANLDIDINTLGRGPLARACLDWSERHDHLAGPLGEAICAAFLQRGFATRRSDGRALDIPPAGLAFMQQHFGWQATANA